MTIVEVCHAFGNVLVMLKSLLLSILLSVIVIIAMVYVENRFAPVLPQIHLFENSLHLTLWVFFFILKIFQSDHFIAEAYKMFSLTIISFMSRSMWPYEI